MTIDPPWVNIINRAVALGVLAHTSAHTVRFNITHECGCMSHYVMEGQDAGNPWLDDIRPDMACDCNPVIFWREVCDPIDQFNIIVDRASSSERGTI